ncbi:hypothetical protein [Heyndrickxia sporothermodurans]|uniref:hypothetical protein n=1 Tax=Heyndrickxia sporothermodurans TaxID=46224 RepID=UPI000D3BD9E8|nr:hypothetical protein [Heyndrickxia sporothermodurans]PTY93112.1 hypothetical protein B5V90_03230 [Heyndrickxia sporothermodurans]
MTKAKEKLLGLLGVRKLIALILTGVFSYLAIVGMIGKDEFLPVFSMVVGYYFGRSTALETSKNDNQPQG